MLVTRSGRSFNLLLDAITGGKAAVMACDTIYGLVGAAPQTESLLQHIKGRREDNPFLQLIPDFSYLEKLGVIVPKSTVFNLWPGPFTLVMNLEKGGSAAFRVPEDERLCKLISRAGLPVFSTSVNRAGQPAMNNPKEIEKEFGSEVALIEDSGIIEGRRPSTVVDLTTAPFRILRQGAGIMPPEFLG